MTGSQRGQRSEQVVAPLSDLGIERYVTEMTMALSNAERQRRHRERQRAKLAEADALRNAPKASAKPRGHASLLREIEALKRKLAKAEETIAEKEGQRKAQEGVAAAMSRAVNDQSNRAMFAEADKERLADELESLRNEDVRDSVAAWLGFVDPDDAERSDFLRRIRDSISDRYVPKDWYEDAALQLCIARGDPIPDGLRRKAEALGIVVT